MELLQSPLPGPDPLEGSSVAVIGFGSQARAHAANLRDSGVKVTVGLRRESPSAEEARAAGFEVMDVGAAAAQADLTALLIPDEEHGKAFHDEIEPVMEKGKTLLFAHGFSIRFGLVSPPEDVDVVMVSPKGPGHQVRKEFEEGRGVVMLVAVHRDGTGQALTKAAGYASAIGGDRAGIFRTTFAEECETDLFGEQAVICGGLSHLVMAGYDTLVEAGYPPELAYFECLHEVKLVADLIQARGLAGMRKVISRTALYGDLTRGPRIISPAVKKEMKIVLEEIRSGSFAREWVEESRTGGRLLGDLLAAESTHPSEEIGRRLRGIAVPDGGEGSGT